MGSAITNECLTRNIVPYQAKREWLIDAVSPLGPNDLVINSCAYIPMPSVDACKLNKDETISGNVLWPQILSLWCCMRQVPLMHLSTGCLFDEDKEYSECDTPTRGWDGYCGFYIGTKLLAEEVVRGARRHYILRLRLPFDEVDHPRNYLSKLRKFDKVYEHQNSLTHRGDFAKWAIDLWENGASYGTYHAVNTYNVSAVGLVMDMADRGMIPKMPEFVKSTECTGATLSAQKLIDAGVKVRSVHDALKESLDNWRTA